MNLNMNFSIPENVDVPIYQTLFQRIDLDSLDYDPGTRKQIWEYHVNQHDEIRWAYIIKDPHQPPLKTFKKVESTIVAFKLLGLEIIQHGLNILLRQMQFIVYPALSFIIQIGLWDKIHSLLVDLEIGERLGAKIVIFKFI